MSTTSSLSDWLPLALSGRCNSFPLLPLREHLQPVKNDVLMSAELIRRRQMQGESVDSFAQEFEGFLKSYGSRGERILSRKMLKRDLFVKD